MTKYEDDDEVSLVSVKENKPNNSDEGANSHGTDAHGCREH